MLSAIALQPLCHFLQRLRQGVDADPAFCLNPCLVLLVEILFPKPDSHVCVLLGKLKLRPSQRYFPRPSLLAEYLGKTLPVSPFAPPVQRFVCHIKKTANFFKGALQAAQALEVFLVYFFVRSCHNCSPSFHMFFSRSLSGYFFRYTAKRY